ncbi:MAG: nitrous oxide reductase family maturation protein NosD [Promethearchaeota archaeon]
MDKKMKNKYALTVLGILLFILPLFASNSVIYNKFQTNNGSNSIDPNISAILPPYEIDDLGGGDFTWEEAATQDWCSGSGTSEDPYLISDQTFDGYSYTHSLSISNSRKHFIVEFSTFIDSGSAGLYLYNDTNGQVLNNVIFNNGYGIALVNVTDSVISGNEIYDNDQDGINIENVNDSVISGNEIYDNSWDGIYIYNSNYLSISNNEIYHNDDNGIDIYNSNYLSISDNDIYDTIYYDGIYLYDTNSTTISNNEIYDNGGTGIELFDNSDKNTIVGNNISGHGGTLDYGTYLGTDCDNNLFYNNFLKNNWRNAYDSGSNNDWNITGLGNYWDDYDGWDNNSDGIGDTPYTNIFGSPPLPSNDSYPIWEIRGPIVIDDFLTTNTDYSGNWTWAVSQPWCSGSGTSPDPYIIQGMTIDQKSFPNATNCLLIANSTADFIIRNCTFFSADDAGISLVNVENAQIIENNAYDNDDYGILLVDCENNTISGNIFNGNTAGFGCGIYLDTSNVTIISGNDASGNVNWGIYLFSSNDNEITENIANNNILEDGIYLEDSDYNMISGNTANDNNDYGIYLSSSNNNEIIENIAYSNDNNDGIYLGSSDNNMISGNTANANLGYGIYLSSSNDNDIIENMVFLNVLSGIYLSSSNYNEITDNYVNDNINWDGITLSFSDNNTITGNYAHNNGFDGIYLSNSDNITISDNEIYGNDVNGIEFFGSNNNTVSGNIIRDNIGNGVSLNSDNNSFYNNYFLRNGAKHAIDVGLNNTWNSSAIGNYWDNYTGPDVEAPYGIGDIPYNISLSPLIQDFLPIVDDSAPSITVYSPQTDDVYGISAPSFSVSISDPVLYDTWYTIDGGEIIFFTGSTGIINQSAWDLIPAGIVNITFWANDTVGNTNSVGVNVTKDLEKPIIYILSPHSGYSYGTDAPDFGLTIIEDHLEDIWYTLNNGTANHISNTTSGEISQTGWDALPQGYVNLTFYANDTAGFLASEDVIIIKDIEAPKINITLPTPNKAFGKIAPAFNVRITDEHLVKMWYTLNNGSNNYYFIDNGTIDQTAWDGLSQGSVLVTFFANDKSGHITSESITIKKKISGGGIGLDFFASTILISIISGVAIISIITKILKKKD